MIRVTWSILVRLLGPWFSVKRKPIKVFTCLSLTLTLKIIILYWLLNIIKCKLFNDTLSRCVNSSKLLGIFKSKIHNNKIVRYKI